MIDSSRREEEEEKKTVKDFDFLRTTHAAAAVVNHTHTHAIGRRRRRRCFGVVCWWGTVNVNKKGNFNLSL